MKQPARGQGLRIHVIRTRFESGCRPGPKPDAKLAPRIVEVRRLLRSDMPVAEIALRLGVSEAALQHFIKRRRLCDMRERRKFISLQKSIAGEPLE